MRTAILFAILLGSLGNLRAEDLSSEQQAELMVAVQAADYDAVIRLTEGVSEDHEWARARAGAFQRRGEERFFDADIDGSIEDFDAFLEIVPRQDPHHWQRGLSYYYAEEYEKGKAQFERHQDVNSQDVENAVWHFLCAVRAPEGSVEGARKNFIPIEHDSRVPMKQVHDLFGGWGSVEAVLEAAKPVNPEVFTERERNHLCYAHLYLGLYFEAMGNDEKMRHHIRLAAYDYAMEHYMGQTAQVHAKIREVKESPDGFEVDK